LAARRLAEHALADIGAALLRLQLLRLAADPDPAFPPHLPRALADAESILHGLAAVFAELAGPDPRADGAARPARFDA
jgi:hypothetical protein